MIPIRPMLATNHTLKIEVANLTKADKEFLSAVVSIFTDPQCSQTAELLRRGGIQLQYHPTGGAYINRTFIEN